MALIGEAFIQISPQLASDFDSKLKGQLGPSLEKAGQLGGQQAGKAASSSFATATTGLAKTVQAPFAEAGKAGGQAAGQAAGTEFKKGASKAGDDAGKEAGKRFGGGLSSALSALGGFFVARRIFSFFQGAIAVVAKFQALSAQTNAAIKSTGGVANVSATGVANLSSRLEDLTTIDDKAIHSAANLLLTFTNVRNEVGEGNDVFDRAVTSLTDMSVALGSDVAGSAIQLGKALNDPIAGITALRRVGVAFTEDQTKMIATLVKSGHTLEAQKIILKELNTEFGGSAKALGGTLQGSINRSADAFENLQQKVGASVAPIVLALGSVASAASHIPPVVITVGATLVGLVAVTLTAKVALSALGTAYEAAGLAALVAAVRMKIAQIALVTSLGGVGAGAKAAFGAFARIAIPVAGIAVAAFALKKAADEYGKVKSALDKVTQGIATTADVTGLSTRVLEGNLDHAVIRIKDFANSGDNVNLIGDAARSTAAEMIGLAFATKNPADAALILSQASKVLHEDLARNQHILDVSVNRMKQVGVATEDVTQEMRDQFDPTNSLTDAQIALAASYDKVNKNIEAFQGLLDLSVNRLLSGKEATSKFEKSIDDMSASLKENGRSFDLHSEKGRNNEAALEDVVRASEDLLQARVRSGRVNADAVSQEREFGRILDVVKGRFPGLRDQITQYQGSLKNIPDHIDTDVRLHAPTQADINGLLKQFHGKIPKAIQAEINLPPVNITANVTGSGPTGAAGSPLHVVIDSKHTGGPITRHHGGGTIDRIARHHGGGTIGGSSREVPILAEVDEYMINRTTSLALGRPFLDALNALSQSQANALIKLLRGKGFMPGYHTGGAIHAIATPPAPRITNSRLVVHLAPQPVSRITNSQMTTYHAGGHVVLAPVAMYHTGGQVSPVSMPIQIRAPRISSSTTHATYHTGGSVTAAGGDDVLVELRELRALIARLLARPAQVNVNEVHEDPRATAFAVSSRLGLEATR